VIVPLSAREIQVMCGVADGGTNKDIGATLSISPLTVKTHILRTLQKLRVSTRAQAVDVMWREGLWNGQRG
jgi:ATP/maltotriose-dependent transcriptional regulator MalT